jgi:hypothetical protein
MAEKSGFEALKTGLALLKKGICRKGGSSEKRQQIRTSS